MSHRTVRQIPGSGSVNSVHLEKNEMWTDIQYVLCVSVSILSVIYWLNKVYRESGSAMWVEEDGKGHGRGRGRRDKSCLCSLSHSSPLSRIHLHTWREKAVPFAPLSVLLKHKQVPLSGPDNSPACLLSVFAQVWVGVWAVQVARGTKSNATSWDWFQRDSSSPQ